MSLLKLTLYIILSVFLSMPVFASVDAHWQQLVDDGFYDEAVAEAQTNAEHPLLQLIEEAEAGSLYNDPMWLTLVHYRVSGSTVAPSRVDAAHFFMSGSGKQDPVAELNATLAALFATEPKQPLRLTAYCRFVARRIWLQEVLPSLKQLLPAQECVEYQRYMDFLQGQTLTLIFPAAHPNSPSSAFGHTLIRIDRKDQTPETRLLNMSLNFAAEVPPDVSSMAYAIKGLSGGFQGKYRLLPYHIKLREYAQIENRDTWEYPLNLSQDQVDRVLRHSYEMLIAHYDYYFLTENCSFHLLTLLDIAFVDEPLATEFSLWTIPVDIIKVLRRRGIVDEGEFVPSTIRTLRERRTSMQQTDSELAMEAYLNNLPYIDSALGALPVERQAGVLDLLADYQRYDRIRENPGATAMSSEERKTLSQRARLNVLTSDPQVAAPHAAPDTGHATARFALRQVFSADTTDRLELSWRPAYHDYRDASHAYGSRAAIDFFRFVLANDRGTDDAYLRQFRLVGIESIEPRGEFFKPVSWHTRLDWLRDSADAATEFVFNVGAGGAWQSAPQQPVLFAFLESDVVDNPALSSRTRLKLGTSIGFHWEPVDGYRFGISTDYRNDVASSDSTVITEAWVSIAAGKQWTLVGDIAHQRFESGQNIDSQSLQLRWYY